MKKRSKKAPPAPAKSDVVRAVLYPGSLAALRTYLGNTAEIDAQEARCREAGMVIVSRKPETVGK